MRIPRATQSVHLIEEAKPVAVVVLGLLWCAVRCSCVAWQIVADGMRIHAVCSVRADGEDGCGIGENARSR